MKIQFKEASFTLYVCVWTNHGEGICYFRRFFFTLSPPFASTYFCVTPLLVHVINCELKIVHKGKMISYESGIFLFRWNMKPAGGKFDIRGKLSSSAPDKGANIRNLICPLCRNFGQGRDIKGISGITKRTKYARRVSVNWSWRVLNGGASV